MSDGVKPARTGAAGEPELAERLKEGEGHLRQAYLEETLRQLDTLARKIARSWRSPKTALELLEEQRR